MLLCLCLPQRRVVIRPDLARPTCAAVAQVVERSPEKAGVGGSTPSRGTIFSITYKPQKPDSGTTCSQNKFWRRWSLSQFQFGCLQIVHAKSCLTYDLWKEIHYGFHKVSAPVEKSSSSAGLMSSSPMGGDAVKNSIGVSICGEFFGGDSNSRVVPDRMTRSHSDPEPLDE